MTRQQEDYQLIVDVWRLLKAYGQPDGSLSQQADALREARMLTERYHQDPFAVDLVSTVMIEIGSRFRTIEGDRDGQKYEPSAEE